MGSSITPPGHSRFCVQMQLPPRSETHPSIDKAPAVVVREGAGLPGLSADRAWQQLGLDQNLEPIADADDGALAGDEILERVADVIHELVGENLSGGDVVAVTEAARESEKLVLAKASRRGDQLVDMNPLGNCAG